MVPVLSLWLPILLSAVLAFVVSSVVHMVLTYHRTDFGKIPDEDGVMEAMRNVGIPPGEYVIPCAGSPEVMKSPEFRQKTEKGPVAFLTVLPSGPPAMGRSLIEWFLYCIVVSVFAAYVSGRALESGASYLAVFRFAGVTAFLGYALALWQNSIWYKRAWSTTLKSTFDGLLYALVTAGTFAWLWPS
jgi:hypothetical protein